MRTAPARGRRAATALLAAILTLLSTVAAVAAVDPTTTCDVTWDGGAGDSSWHSPANWSTDAVPVASASACLAGAGVTVSGPAQVAAVQGGSVLLEAGSLRLAAASDLEHLVVAGGTLQADGDVAVAQGLEQTGGTVTGAGRITVSGEMSWTGGVQSGSGATDVHLLDLPAGTDRSITGRLVGGDHIAFSGTGEVRLADDAAELSAVSGLFVHDVQARLTGPGRLVTPYLEVGGTESAPGELEIQAQYGTGDGETALVTGHAALVLAETVGRQEGDFVVDGPDAVLRTVTDQVFLSVAQVQQTGGGRLEVLFGTTAFLTPAALGQVVNTGTLLVADAVTADGVDNRGEVVLEGAGALTVTGPDGYLQQGAEDDETLRTVLDGPGTRLAATAPAPVRVVDGVLAGSGTVEAALSNDGGTVDPAGELRVTGSYTQAGAGTLHVDEAHGVWDRLLVDHSAALAGVLALPLGGVVPTEPTPILQAGAVDGAFDLVLGDGAACGDVAYEPTQVVLVPETCVTVPDSTATEGEPVVSVPVRLTAPLTSETTVDWYTVAGSATDGTDYTGSAGTVWFPPGTTASSIEVALVDDDTAEPDEAFTLALTATGATLTRSSARVTVADDDETAPTYELRPVLDEWTSTFLHDIGSDRIVGSQSPEFDVDDAWFYRVSDDAFFFTASMDQILGLNGDDDAVGTCPTAEGGGAGCFRSRGVNTLLQHGTGQGAEPVAVNDADAVVGGWVSRLGDGSFRTQAVMWPAPDQPGQAIGLTGESSRAVDVSESGWVVGDTTFRSDATTTRRVWVRDPSGTTTDLGTLPERPELGHLEADAVGEGGTVYGRASDGTPGGEFAGWEWTADAGFTVYEGHSFVMDVNRHGDAVGLQDGLPVLRTGTGRTFPLRDAVVGSDLTVVTAEVISDERVIAGRAIDSSGGSTIVALVPEGAGCELCTDVWLTEPTVADPAVHRAVLESTTDGNVVHVGASVENRSDSDRTVEVTFLGPDGRRLADPVRATVPAGTVYQDLSARWDTAGLAWDAGGRPAGAHTVQVEVRDLTAGTTSLEEQSVRVDPRPVIALHGMNSDASTWSAYAGFLHARHERWDVHAVDTMDTMPWTPSTIAENARRAADYIAAKRAEHNAWHVDLVAHSMGGLISRYYVQNLMPLDQAGRPTARHVVMLGTPNAGSACADLFSVPLTRELRTDSVARFNTQVTDRRGVPFSVAAGVSSPVTCDDPSYGDDVVAVDSAQHDMTDTEVYDVRHTAMTGSAELFSLFVLPRLSDTHYVTASDADTSSLASAATGRSPQLLSADPLHLAAGASTEVQLSVPPDATAAGVAVVDGAALQVTALRDGVEVAQLPPATDAPPIRALPLPGPVAGTWVLRYTNTGSADLRSDARVWVEGLPTRLTATAEQTAGTSSTTASLQLTAQYDGVVPEGHSTVTAVLTAPDGTTHDVWLADDGASGDGAAGDGLFGAVVPDLGPGAHTATVHAVSSQLVISTTTSADLRTVEDGPGDDAPVTWPATATTSRDRPVTVTLEAVDPEGSDVTYEVVDGPAHGTLGGELPVLTYTPAPGWRGTDTFTWRATADGLSSALEAATVVVGAAATELTYEAPVPAEGTVGSDLQVRVRLVGPLLEGVDGVPVELSLGGHTVTATTSHGDASAVVPLDVPAGTHPLTVTFAGTDEWAPSSTVQSITVTGGGAPRPALPDGATGEAGYPLRLLVVSGDPDRDGAQARIDYTADGSWDAEAALGAHTQSTSFVHTYDEAVEGSVRVEVTDRAGNVGTADLPLSIAPYRPLGRLSIVTVDGLPVDGVDVSADGSRVLVEHRDLEGDSQLPTPYALLDPATGSAPVVSVRPDGLQVDFPVAGAVSSNGAHVAFSAFEDGGATVQAYVRDVAAGTTRHVSVRPDGSPADRGTTVLDVSDDGRYVLVSSTATGLTDPGETACDQGPCRQVYLLDTATRSAEVLSLDGDGRPYPAESQLAAMTPDASVVVAQAGPRMLVHDRAAGTTTPLRLLDGQELPDVNGAVSGLDLSADGRHVLLTTTVPRLHPSDDSTDADVYRYDRTTAELQLVSATPDGSSATGTVGSAVLSGDGRAAAFVTAASDVAGHDDGVDHVYLRDLVSGSTRLVSQEDRDGVPGTGDSRKPLLSTAALLFGSSADDLVPGDVDGTRSLFSFALAGTGNAAPVLTVPEVPGADEGALVDVVVAAQDADGDVLTWTWQVDGGAVEQAQDGSASLRLGDGPASAQVRVQVSDGTDTVEAVVPIEVRNLAPTVDAGADVTVPWGVPVVLDGVVDDASAADRAAGLQPTWSFSDGTTATGDDASHVFADPGAASARLSATDKDGASGSDTVDVTVERRTTSLAVTAVDGAFGSAHVRADLRDPVDGAVLVDREVLFAVDGGAPTRVRTGDDGAALLTGLPPGQHDVVVHVPADARYDSAAGSTGLSVSQSAGKVTGTIAVAEGEASFDVRYDGSRTKGTLTWSTGGRSTKASLSSLGVDGNVAWAGGRTSDGRPVLLQVEDHGESGVGDVFRLWLDGRLVTATGQRLSGNVQVHAT